MEDSKIDGSHCVRPEALSACYRTESKWPDRCEPDQSMFNAVNKKLLSQGASIKIVHANQVMKPKCSIEIRGDHYRGTFLIGIDAAINRLIYNAIKKLDECKWAGNDDEKRNKQVEAIINSCQTIIQSLFKSCSIIDERRNLTPQERSQPALVLRNDQGKQKSTFNDKGIVKKLYKIKKPTERRKSKLIAATQTSPNSKDLLKNHKTCSTSICLLKKISCSIRKRMQCHCKTSRLGRDVAINTLCCPPSEINSPPTKRGEKDAQQMSVGDRPAAAVELYDHYRRRLNASKTRLAGSTCCTSVTERLLGLLPIKSAPTDDVFQPVVEIDDKKIYLLRKRYKPNKQSLALKLKTKSKHYPTAKGQTNTDLMFNDLPNHVRLISPFKAVNIEKTRDEDGDGKVDVLLNSGQTITVISAVANKQMETQDKGTQSYSHYNAQDRYLTARIEAAQTACRCSQNTGDETENYVFRAIVCGSQSKLLALNKQNNTLSDQIYNPYGYNGELNNYEKRSAEIVETVISSHNENEWSTDPYPAIKSNLISSNGFSTITSGEIVADRQIFDNLDSSGSLINYKNMYACKGCGKWAGPNIAPSWIRKKHNERADFGTNENEKLNKN